MKSPIARTRGRPRSFNNTGENTLIQSLDRALNTLKIVADGDGLSLTELSHLSQQSPSTVYRALLTFQKHRMVDFDEAGQLWHIGMEAFRIGSAVLGRTGIVEESRPVMQHIMATTGETANLAIIDQSEVVFISQVETHEPIRAFFHPGTRGPIYASGIGKALLAFFPKIQLDRLIKEQAFDAFTENTIVEPDALLEQLAMIRDRGWAVDDEERTIGMRCIAAPIFNPFGEAAAGISISGPSVRMTPNRDSEFGTLIKQAADRITLAIGGRPVAEPSPN